MWCDTCHSGNAEHIPPGLEREKAFGSVLITGFCGQCCTVRNFVTKSPFSDFMKDGLHGGNPYVRRKRSAVPDGDVLPQPS